MVGELVADLVRLQRVHLSRSMGCDMSDGVPVWTEDILTLREYGTSALCFRACLKLGEQDRAVARLWAHLQGPVKEAVRTCRLQDLEDAPWVERFLRIMRESPACARR